MKDEIEKLGGNKIVENDLIAKYNFNSYDVNVIEIDKGLLEVNLYNEDNGYITLDFDLVEALYDKMKGIRYTKAYDELFKLVKPLRQYYDIDKIKIHSVYVWTKGDDGENVFDITCNGIIDYEEHEIIEDAKPIINSIHEYLKKLKKERYF